MSSSVKKTTTIIFAIIICLAVAGVFQFGFNGASVVDIIKADNRPNIISVEASPYKVQVGDILTITAEIEDSFGIDKVMADMAGIDVIELKFVEGEGGSVKKGTWQGQWRVYNTLAKTYTTTITATNIKGFSATREVEWEDPADWLTDYDYRKAIMVDNTAGSELTNYQVKVENPIYDETGLVGSWHFEEATVSNGVTVADSSGQGNTGTYTSDDADEKSTASGKYDRGLTFDGTGDYVQVSDVAALRLQTSFTLEAWVYIAGSTNTLRTIISRLGESDRWGYVLRVSSGNVFQFGIDSTGPPDGWYINGGAATVGSWYHVVGTYDSALPSNKAVLYVNNINVASGGNSDLPAVGAFDVYIGSSGLGYPFNGDIDEVKIYNRALSPAEIKAHYEAKAKLNYGDVRFTDSGGATLIDHWAEKDGTYWVEVPTIPASSNYTIYMYYGKSAATSASNGTNTFIQWHGYDTGDFIDSLIVPYQNVIYESQIQFTSAVHNINFGLGMSIADKPVPDYVDTKSYTPTNNFFTRTALDSSETYQQLTPSASINTNHKIKIIVTSSGATYFLDTVQQGTEITTTMPDSNMGLYSYRTAGTAYQDWSFIRKYAATEPTIYTYAEQENLVFANRKVITLSGSGSAETDYQVKLLIGKTSAAGENFNLGGNCKDKFGDIRFGDSNGNTYSYWIESVTGTGAASLATVWVKVPTIPATGTVIYIYYNNAVASDASNGDATFEFFDDFSGSGVDSAKWTNTEDSPSVSSGILSLKATDDATDLEGISTADTFAVNSYILRLRASQSNVATLGSLGFSNTATITTAYTTDDSAYFNLDATTGGNFETSTTNESTAENNVGDTTAEDTSYHIFEVIPTTSNTVFKIDDSTEKTHSTQKPDEAMNIRLQTTDITNTISVDWTFVRKYAATEPAYSADATAEAGSYNANKWHYRKAITINSSSALYNYQVKLDDVDTATLITAGKMNSDCSDIRFASTDDFDENDWTVSYPYWIESGCNSATTDIWVRTDALANSATNIIYMYYSNPSAIPSTNGDAVFLYHTTSLPGSAGTQDSFGVNTAIRFNVEFTAHSQMFGYAISTSSPRMVILADTTKTPDIDYHSDLGHEALLGGSDVNTGYKIYDIIRNSTTNVITYVDNSNYQTHTYFSGDNSEIESDGTYNFQWALVRKYTATEPSASMGNEGVPRIFGSPIISPSGGGMMSF